MLDYVGRIQQELEAALDNRRQHDAETGHTVFVIYIDENSVEQRRIMRNVTRDERNALLAATGVADGKFGAAVEDHHTFHISGNCRELMDKVCAETGSHRRHKLYTVELEASTQQASAS